MIAEFLEGWLDGRLTEAEVQERTAALDLEIPEPFGVTLVHLEDKDNAEIGGEWDDDLLFYAAENMAREVFQPFRPVSTCRNPAGELVLISSGEPRAEWEAAGGTIEKPFADPPAGGCLFDPARGRKVRGPAGLL